MTLQTPCIPFPMWGLGNGNETIPLLPLMLFRNSTSESMFLGIIDISVDVYIWYFIVLYMLGPLHLLFSAWMVTEYFLLNWKNFVLPSFVSNIVLPSFISNIVTKIKKKLKIR